MFGHVFFMNRAASVLLTVLIVLGTSASGAASEPDSLELFDTRIMPIFRSAEPSSCVQCHLSSVDLKNYILPSSDATFVSLRDQGLIDLNSPQDSRILNLIRMGDKDLDEAARLIHEKMRTAELEAFSTWIAACCQSPRMRALPSSTVLARPEVPDEVIRHARKSRVVDSFVRNVWSQRMRCFPCHAPHEIDESNPRQQAAVKTYQELTKRYDVRMLERLEIFRETPEETLAYLIESSKSTPEDRLPLIDLKDPANSLLIQKPMSKLPPKRDEGTFEEPSYRFPLTHMGGLKLHPHDQTYKSWVAWIQDYAKVTQGAYQSTEELPVDNWYPSQLVLRIKGAPAAWPVGGVVQLFVHERDDAEQRWHDDPVAFTQGTVTPRRMVNGALFLLGMDESRVERWGDTAELPRGRFLVKAFVDTKGKVEHDPTVILDVDDFYGEAEIPKARWREGFRHAEIVSGTELKKPQVATP